MDWSPEQTAALDAVGRWLERAETQVFALFGYAGSGKTTLAKSFAERCKGKVMFGAYTGKAALVLQQKGCPASTIHRLIYQPKDKSRLRLLELESDYTHQAALAPEHQLSDHQAKLAELQQQIAEEKQSLKRPSFSLNEDSEIREASLVVIDEVSMVGSRMGEDLLSFGRPILVLGDPAQLPPVADGGFFTERQPDVMLTGIHRQGAGSPIIMLATKVRQGEELPLGTWGESRVIQRRELTIAQAAAFDQIICGTNKTRKALNRRIRTEVLGRKSHLPEPGDKLVCLRNNHELGLLNGGQWRVEFCNIIDDDLVALSIVDPSDESNAMVVSAHRAIFEDREISLWQRRDAEEFDYGFAMTCHKSQGSQYDRVLVVDESGVFREHSRRWLYTAVTRAAQAVTVVRL